MTGIRLISGEIEKLRERIERTEEALRKIPEEITELESQLEAVRKALADREREVLQIARSIRDNEHRFRELKQRILYHDKYLRRADSPREYEKLLSDREKLTAKAFALSSELEDLRDRYDRAKAEELELYRKELELEGKLEGLKREYGALLNELRGLTQLLERKIRELEEKFNL